MGGENWITDDTFSRFPQTRSAASHKSFTTS